MISLLHTVTTDPVDRSALTCRVWFEGGQVVAGLGVGPGVGPHVTTSPRSFRAWLEAMEVACSVFEALYEAHNAPGEEVLDA